MFRTNPRGRLTIHVKQFDKTIASSKTQKINNVESVVRTMIPIKRPVNTFSFHNVTANEASSILNSVEFENNLHVVYFRGRKLLDTRQPKK